MRLRWLLRATAARRIRVFTLGVIVTLAFLIFPSWNTWHVYRASEKVSSQELRLERLIGTVIYLDEVLTLSARMATVTGDAGWEERYRHYEPQLVAAIEEAIQLSAGAYAAAAEQTAAASRNLVAIENRALALTRQGRLEEAQALLVDETYAKSKRAYADGLQVLTAASDDRIQRSVEQSERRILGAGALTLVSAGALLLAWVGVVGLIWRHLIARQKADEERLYHQAQLEHVQKLESLGVMAGGIAHDFNNLLMPILGNVGIALSDLPSDSPTVGRLERARDAGRRLSELTKQLMAYSGSVAFDPRPLDLSRLIEEMTNLLQISVSKKATLRFELSDDLPAVQGDSSQIAQVAMNLVTNASEALGEESGTIEVRTGVMQDDLGDRSGAYVHEDLSDGPYVYLEVSDSGCGMNATTRRQIFDPFFTTKFTGRGLGLAVVLGIVRGHRGAICVDSEPDRGTAFRILFSPTDQAAEPVVSTRKPDGQWRSQGTVLVVDDDLDVRELIGEMLRRIGFAVLSAQEGSEGLEMFRKQHRDIDLVLLDLTMPGISGEEALRRIHRIQPDQPVVLMSGYSEEFAAARLEGPIGGFLQKPFTHESLAEALRATLRNPV
jgi:signal transduction histidine kinase/CheY-like chemotaxis protein